MASTTLAKHKKPLYQHIQDELRHRIIQGLWEEGQALPPRRTLCQEFQTTRITLDKAIHGLIQEGWVRASAGSGTFVALPPGRQRREMDKSDITRRNTDVEAPPALLRIGVVLGHDTPPLSGRVDSNFFFGPLFQGIRDGLMDKPVNITYAQVSGGDYTSIESMPVDGLIVIAPHLGDGVALRDLSHRKTLVAVALSARYGASDGNLLSVDTDNRTGAYAAMQYLLEMGHRDIGLVSLAFSHSNQYDRYCGYLQALSDACLRPAPQHLVLYPAYHEEIYEEMLTEWVTQALAARQMPTALLVGDYLMTLATLRVLKQSGFRIPEDVSVIGFDDTVSAAYLTPPLTVVRQPIRAMGQRAADHLLHQLQNRDDGEPGPTMELLPMEIVPRESVGPPRSKELSL